MAESNDPVELEAERARAGETPHVTRYILLVSLVLVVAIFAWLVWIW
jgi:hypothetical protein